MQKRVLAVHDISCVGKCSLTVALPIISSAGVETSVLPTAVLSTHTGGFEGYTFRDLTDDIIPIINHWKTLDLKIDAIYTGYLGSFEQLNLMKKLFGQFNDSLVLVDPVMGDHGKLYPAFTKDFAKGMRSLCEMADIVVPNLTEASFMLDRPYIESGYDEDYIVSMLKELGDLGPDKVVLTGVTFDEDKLGAASYNKTTGEINYYFQDKIEGYYHGTGDVFGSALIAALMNDKTIEEAMKIAVEFTVGCIQRTKIAGTDVKYGVDFENEIPNLIRLIL